MTGKLTQSPSESAIAQTQTLRQLLRHKFQQDSEVENILIVIEQGSRTDLDQLVERLKTAIQQDASFAAQLQDIVQSIYPEKLQATDGMAMTASGNAQAFQTKVEGGTANIGNTYVIQPQPLPSPVGIPENLPRGGIEPEKFVGRADELQWLHDRLQQENYIAISAIAGMGGVGKTELALQYAISHQNAYPGGICWLEAREDVGTQIINFAKSHLGLNPPESLKDMSSQVGWCWQHWNPGEVLIIFDDVTDYVKIKLFLPPSNSRFRVLITTRLRLLKVSERIELNVLKPDAARSLLELLAGVERIQAEVAIAEAICQWLGYLPLGLELVGRYLARKQNLSLSAMLERLEAKKLEQPALKKPKSEADMTAQLGVAAAFDLGWQELPALAQTIGCFFSIFAIVPLSWSLVEQCFATYDSEALEEAKDDWLLDFHLLQHEGKGTYKLHELIREFFQSKLVELEQTESLWQAITLKVAMIATDNSLLVAEILNQKLLDWSWITNPASLSALEWGWQVRTATQAWMVGIGPLANIVFPLREDGTLPTLGVSLSQQYADQPWGPIPYVQTGWNFSSSETEEVIALPPESEQVLGDDEAAQTSAWMKLSDASWNHFRSTPLNQQAFWVWQRTFETIGSSLTERLKTRTLPVESGHLSLEAAWHAALCLMQGNYPYSRFSLTFNPMPLNDLATRLSSVRPSQFSLMMQHCLNQLQIEVEQAQAKGETHLSFPDAIYTFKTCSAITSDNMLDYTAAVYQGALKGYQQLVHAWFPKFQPRLELASILPVRIVGIVVPPTYDLGAGIVSWFWDPMPPHSESGVDFQLRDRPFSGEEPQVQAAFNRLQSLRTQKLMHHWLQSRSESPLTKSWLGVSPVTELVYQWLWEDLKKIGWVKGDLGNAGNPYWR